MYLLNHRFENQSTLTGYNKHISLMGDFNCFFMLKNTNNINYIHSTGSLGSQVSGAHIQVEMDLISHNSTRDVAFESESESGRQIVACYDLL